MASTGGTRNPTARHRRAESGALHSKAMDRTQCVPKHNSEQAAANRPSLPGDDRPPANHPYRRSSEFKQTQRHCYAKAGTENN